MRELVVEESFEIGNRGVVALFRGDQEGLPLGARFSVSIQRDDGVVLEGEASVEHVLRRRPVVEEHCSLLIYRLSKTDVPPGSVVRLSC